MKSRSNPSGRSSALGMSLIELMIAMVLGLIIAGAAVALFATNRLTYSATESMGRIQESSRVAFELLSRDLRDAGGIPCDASLAGTMQNGLNAPTTKWYANWDNGLRGYNGTTAFTAPAGTDAFGTTVIGNRVSGTDAIELKSAEPTDVVVASNVTDANRNAAIPVNNVTGLQLNDVLVVCDFHGGTIFQVSSTPSGTTLVHAAGVAGNSPGNVDGTLDLGSYGNDKLGNPVPAMSMNSVIAVWRPTRWYIGCNIRVACDKPGGRSLYETRWVNNAGTYSFVYDEIAAGVTNMDVQYLLTGASSYVADESTITSWPLVTAVKITLTFQGQDNSGSEGTPISKSFTHIVTLRDHLP